VTVPHDHDRGLTFDLATMTGRRLMDRRRALQMVAGGGDLLATSQLAIPEDVCDQVYPTDGYAESVTNLSQLSLESDNVSPTGPRCSSPR
jgi:hypothetical protein